MQTTLKFDSTNCYETTNNRQVLVANEFILSYKRYDYVSALDDGKLNNSKSIANFLREIWDPNRISFQESFYVLYFSTQMKLTGYFKIADGTVNAVPVDTKMIYTSALLSGSHRIILAHNHPSGNVKPSKADMLLTEKVIEGGKLLDISVEDHIIITSESYYSFRDNGLI